MNRELKVRVWNQVDKKFYSINSDHWTLRFGGDIWMISKNCPTIQETIASTTFFKLDSEFIQLFTGLKYKNGKEIYEGDIVGYHTYYTQHKTVYDIVCIRPPTLWLKNEEFGYEGERLILPRDTKVVGNIFENPDLAQKQEVISTDEEKVISADEEELDLDDCPSCSATAWDGYICHNCGAKEI